MRSLAPPTIAPPFARYAHGVAVPAGHRLVVTSGQLGLAADGSVPEGAAAQAAICFANLDAILTATGAAGVPVLLAGLPAPGNYGPDFRRDFEAMYVDLAQEHDAILVPDFLGPLGEKATQGLSIADLMQDDRIHPNAEGVRQIVAAIGPEVERLLERARDTDAP